MLRSKKIKYLVLLGVALALVISLVAGACAPAAPTGEEADCSDVEAELTSEKAKVSDLEDEVSDLEAEIAGLKKPAKVYRWEPSVWISAGSPWDYLLYMAEILEETSDGRIEMTPSAPGAVVPVEELAEAVGAGTTQAMLPTPSYYAGKFPMAAVYNTSIGLPTWVHMANCYEKFQDGRAFELYKQEMEKLYNVEVVAERIGPVLAIISSRIDVPTINDLEGMKFRCGDDHFAGPLTALGASTVWAPGTEIYTMLATGVVDAFTYGSAYDHYGMSFHEVTNYWVRTPSIMGANNEQFVVNRDIWNEMSDDLKDLVIAASDAANFRQGTEGEFLIASAWKDVIEFGITPIDWPEGDAALWVEKQMEWMSQYEDDPAVAEFNQIVHDYDVMMGIL
jgi:TRAP-type C4-dicarboxylate transport system substrate-binding protein